MFHRSLSQAQPLARNLMLSFQMLAQWAQCDAEKACPCDGSFEPTQSSEYTMPFCGTIWTLGNMSTLHKGLWVMLTQVNSLTHMPRFTIFFFFFFFIYCSWPASVFFSPSPSLSWTLNSVLVSCRIFVVGIGFFSLCFLMTSLGGQFSAKRPGDSPFTMRAEGKPCGSHVITARSPVTTVVGNEQAGNMLRARRGFLDCHQPADRPAHFAHQEYARGGTVAQRNSPAPLIYTSISLYTCFHPCSVLTWPFSDPHEVIVQLLVAVFNEYLLVMLTLQGCVHVRG